MPVHESRRPKTNAELNKEKHVPRTGYPGNAKKDGAGGKFTWGDIMDDTAAPIAIDKNDPNYDSQEEND
ncbi:hypothetical protein MHBO_001844 [Bonamia ostreae]|uniref:Hyaluronan/mRNA-binding protein domain-containing protein n=1 Tax=Bonamia ostreae TaxID=126728 RepID=A0ABV2AKZ8_9EUKA